MSVTAAEEPGQRRSVTAIARRSQIVGAAIATIAELGYGQASFARIAERAGLSSTRLISYHFAGKNDLIDAVLAEVYRDIAQFMAGRLSGQRSARDALRAYITSLVEFIATHRTAMQAAMEIFLEHRTGDGTRTYDAGTERDVLDPVQGILRAGQDSAEFRAFDTLVMARTIQRAIDGLPFVLNGQPDLDLGAYATELAALFEHATRAER